MCGEDSRAGPNTRGCTPCGPATCLSATTQDQRHVLLCVLACAQVAMGCAGSQQGGGHEVGEEVIYKGDTVKVVDRVQPQYGYMTRSRRQTARRWDREPFRTLRSRRRRAAPLEAVEIAR